MQNVYAHGKEDERRREAWNATFQSLIKFIRSNQVVTWFTPKIAKGTAEWVNSTLD